MTREERINNLMGLKHSKDVFKGEVIPSTDPFFKEFEHSQDGVRAGTKILLTYVLVHGIRTIAGIINRWAPTSENDTEAYINDVCKKTGKPPYYTLTDADIHNADFMVDLVKAIIYHENGEVTISDGIIRNGVIEAYA